MSGRASDWLGVRHCLTVGQEWLIRGDDPPRRRPNLWLTVSPARVDAVCSALSRHDETPFVAEISGRANVVASVTCRSLEELYRYLTERVGTIEGVPSFEVSPVLPG